MSTSGYHPSFETHERKDSEPSQKEQGFYHKTAWRKIRLMALQRDHYLCQACLKKGIVTIATEVHHLQPLEQFPSLGLELSNLQSLCWQCHEDTKPRKSFQPRPGIKIIRVSDGSDDDIDIDD